jgi:hypothetical protein
MKQYPNYLAMLVVLLATSTVAFAKSPATPLERAQQVADLTTSGPYDPAPPVPASDIVVY